MHASLRYGPIFGFEDFVAFGAGLLIFMLVIALIETGVMVFLMWGKFGQSLKVSLAMNAASTIFGVGGVVVGTMGFDSFSLWLELGIAFLLSVLIEAGILMLMKRETARRNWVVSLAANGASYGLVILPLARLMIY